MGSALCLSPRSTNLYSHLPLTSSNSHLGLLLTHSVLISSHTIYHTHLISTPYLMRPWRSHPPTFILNSCHTHTNTHRSSKKFNSNLFHLKIITQSPHLSLASFVRVNSSRVPLTSSHNHFASYSHHLTVHSYHHNLSSKLRSSYVVHHPISNSLHFTLTLSHDHHISHSPPTTLTSSNNHLTIKVILAQHLNNICTVCAVTFLPAS